MIRKLLIANRGEIACRVIATARRMGIATVAVYSEADAGALHVEMADEALCIGPAEAAQSYLNVEALLDAAKATGADAVHPGYGFLSENPEFVEALSGAGLTFVGPPASAIRAMGFKDAAKALMEASGVPVVPGYHGADQDAALLAEQAQKIGYPVLIKARAGGGGKGMRLVERAEDFAEALAGAQREGLASFGDGAVLVEKFVTRPRHVEVQVFADSHGHVVHLFERDCSLQRRHQKVIEEAPAPGMPPEVRAAMGQAAVEAARAIGYVGAGTVEFIADGSGDLRADGFWFMEMNTRLQVEHPVTEAVTGLDLVEWQLKVASGEALPLDQAALALDGHAFEARIYAEDAAAGFLPATGRISALDLPGDAAFARGDWRVDSGVRAGSEITPFYDPMIAKVIAHGPDRASALAALQAQLAASSIAGLQTNLGFLRKLAAHAGFAAGSFDTGLIGRDLADLVGPEAPDAAAWGYGAVAALGLLDAAEAGEPWAALRGFRSWGPAVQRLRLRFKGDEREIAVGLADGGYVVDGEAFYVTPEGAGHRVVAGGAGRVLRAVLAGRQVSVLEDSGDAWIFDAPDPLDAEAAAAGGDAALKAPMPGLVRQVNVAAGDAVAAGQALVVLEAMKMEHVIAAPREGVVAEVACAAGDQVAGAALLVRLEEAADG